MAPPIPGVPVPVIPFSASDSIIPSGVCQTMDPLLRSMAVSVPQGGVCSGMPSRIPQPGGSQKSSSGHSIAGRGLLRGAIFMTIPRFEELTKYRLEVGS